MQISPGLRHTLVRVAPLIGIAISLGVTWWILIGPIMDSDPWSGFRLYFANDQLSYARIATNVANAGPWFTEPFTQTGTSYYPSLWYFAIGLFSAATGLSVPSAWTILGVGIVSLMIGVFAVTAWKLSGQWWATLTPALAITAGTSSSLLQGPSFEGFWQTRLDHHAVLWGPFGTLFTLNAEVAATSFVALGLLAFFLASLPGTTRPLPLLVTSGLLIGVTGNMQTYAFLTGVFLLATWGTVLVLLRARSRRLTASTAVILVVTLASGPLVAEFVAQLATYACVLLAALPAALHRFPHRYRSLLALTVPLAVAASPQLIRTGIGLLSGDAFLAYREASTENLGVPVVKGLAAAAIPLLIWFAAWMAPRMTIHFRALLLALPAAAIILVSNNYWGFDQEPYRFWLQMNTLSLLLLAVAVPAIFAQWYRHRIRYPRRLPAAYLVLTMAGSLYVTGLGDLFGFWDYAKRQGTITATPNPGSDQAILQSLTQDLDGLVATDPCIDPQVLGLLTPTPVAHYNLGLAWPDDPEALQRFIAARGDGFLDSTAARDAGVTSLITYPACDSGWQPTPRDGFFPLKSDSGFWLWQSSDG
ncbi:hypothetical protein N9C30_00110 [bacterium]|nr:hypothetical protein [bacterium]